MLCRLRFITRPPLSTHTLSTNCRYALLCAVAWMQMCRIFYYRHSLRGFNFSFLVVSAYSTDIEWPLVSCPTRSTSAYLHHYLAGVPMGTPPCNILRGNGIHVPVHNVGHLLVPVGCPGISRSVLRRAPPSVKRKCMCLSLNVSSLISTHGSLLHSVPDVLLANCLLHFAPVPTVLGGNMTIVMLELDALLWHVIP